MSALNIIFEICVLLGVYVVAGVPFGLIVVKRAVGVDVRTVGSGSAGATNVFRAAGLRWFTVVVVLDVAKGALLMWLALFLLSNEYFLGLAPSAIIAGHSWSVWAGFGGGKGALVGISSVAVLYYELWWAWLIIVGTAGLAIYITRTTSIVSLLGGVTVTIFVVGMSVWGELPLPYLVGLGVSASFILLRHKDNIRRLLTGSELKMNH